MIGYYVHHHGSGHLTRARLLAARLGEAVTGIGSLPRPDDWAGAWIQLPHDATPVPPAGGDLTAGGVLHWAPTGHSGYTARMAAISSWVERDRPRLVVVDVSVEVTLFVRLLGVPVVVVAMRGDRSDRAHTLAYDAAEALIALWPAALASRRWPPRWVDKTCHTGGFSRLDDLARDSQPAPVQPGSVLLLWGRGGDGAGPSLERASAASGPEWSWRRPHPNGDAAALWSELTRAEVVVSHAGQNAVAEVAASRRPAVVVAEMRPFGEQEETAEVIDTSGIAVGLSTWPSDDAWPRLLTQARDRGGAHWREWSDLDGVARAAALLERVGATT
ncbi:MAG: glycosyltransferase [Terracoccus sp.]